MHRTAYNDCEAFIRKYNTGKWDHVAEVGSLDINGSIRPLFDGICRAYTGIDLNSGPGVNIVVASPYNWFEIDSNSFDLVVSTQCMEHVCAIWQWILEVARIAKKGALIYICAPNTMAYHACPVDCWRVWPNGMRALMEYACLDVLEAYKNDYGDTTGIARKP